MTSRELWSIWNHQLSIQQLVLPKNLHPCCQWPRGYFFSIFSWYTRKCIVILNCYSFPIFIMTSSNGNIFRVTGPLCGEFIGHRWIPCTKASDAELCSLIFPWLNGWVNSHEAGDLRRHRAHYDVIVMWTYWNRIGVNTLIRLSQFQRNMLETMLKQIIWNYQNWY